MRSLARILGALAFIFLVYTATNRVAVDPPALVPGGQPAPGGPVQITFLDVGQGDGALIWSPEGKIALIDAGRSDVAYRLRRLGIDTIDIIIASHAHADHIQGIDEVLQQFPVRYYLDNGLPHTTVAYMRVMDALRALDITYLAPTERTLELGSVSLRILPPPGGDDQNNNSVGVLVEFGDFTALFTGDSEHEELTHFIRAGVPDVTLLKAAHHGSRNGVTPAWLDMTQPDVVVISVGRQNSYGHPNRWAVRYYESTAEEVYRTDLHGGISVSAYADGTYYVTTEEDLTLSRVMR